MAWEESMASLGGQHQPQHGDSSRLIGEYHQQTFDPALRSQYRPLKEQTSHNQALDPYGHPINLATRIKSSAPQDGPISQDTYPEPVVETHKRLLRPQLSSSLRVRTDPQETFYSGDPAPSHPSLSTESSFASQASNGSLDSITASPKAERLPSFRQLSKIAAAGEEEIDSRPAIYPAPPSMPTAMSAPSPVIAPQPYSQPQQVSPVNNFAYGTHPSSTGAYVEARDPYFVNSPPSATYSAPNYYPRRRSVPHSAPPSLPPSLPSASSSGESHGQLSSGNEGYSTAHTTPIVSSVSLDASGRPSVPSLPHMQSSGSSVPGTFTCDFHGCTAAPFQTQYLLNSHANVHSSSRPHYCPVAGCPRSEGGKGFKRKNEMIRHGLVHDSPGYMCPYCPDREHKYPRPDNLQRHVRVHHVDKDKDDAILREVLAQRSEGGNRGRRRRTGP